MTESGLGCPYFQITADERERRRAAHGIGDVEPRSKARAKAKALWICGKADTTPHGQIVKNEKMFFTICPRG
jgi:hypothetical protein